MNSTYFILINISSLVTNNHSYFRFQFRNLKKKKGTINVVTLHLDDIELNGPMTENFNRTLIIILSP